MKTSVKHFDLAVRL